VNKGDDSFRQLNSKDRTDQFLTLQRQRTADLLQGNSHIFQAVHDLDTNYFLINLFIIMSQEFSEPGNTCKTIGKVRSQQPVFTQDIIGLCI